MDERHIVTLMSESLPHSHDGTCVVEPRIDLTHQIPFVSASSHLESTIVSHKRTSATRLCDRF